jgi:hypothetical protein
VAAQGKVQKEAPAPQKAPAAAPVTPVNEILTMVAHRVLAPPAFVQPAIDATSVR